MGSIQKMSSTEMTSESRDVEMRDIEGDDQSTATEAVSKVMQASGISDDATQSPHVPNSHMTSGKGDIGAGSPENRVDQPLPSVETDGDASSSTAAAEQDKIPEHEPRDTIHHSSPPQNSASVPVPTSAESVKLEQEIARLNEVLAETSPQAAQKVMKDKWRYFLFDNYDEAHISFILRAGFKNATASVTEKVLQDKSLFRELLLDVVSRKSTVIEKVLTNATAEQLLRFANQKILDQAVAGRFKTVSAKQLIYWLARADRLGYKMDDIIDEDDESVVPRAGSFERDIAEGFGAEPAQAQAPAPVPARAPVPTPVPVPTALPSQKLASAVRDPLLVEQERNLAALRLADAARILQQKHAQHHQQQRPNSQSRPPAVPGLICPWCKVTLPTESGYNFHITKKPCQKTLPPNAKWRCTNCMQTFTTKQGMDYHTMKGVCSSEDIARATSPSNQLLQEAASVAQDRPPTGSSQQQASIPSIPRPSFIPSQPTPTASYTPHASSAMPSQQPLPRSDITLQRPPLHTPTSTPGPRKQAPPPDDIRQSPSELSAERLAALNRELQDADNRYQQQISEIPANATEEERTARLVSLKNANASRKSQIRKAHGVSLRLREKDKQARKALGTPPSGQNATEPKRMSMTSMTSMTSTPPTASPKYSFSPINTPPRTGPSPDPGLHSNLPNVSQAPRYNGPSQNPPHPSQASRYNGPAQNPPLSRYYGPPQHFPHPSQGSRYYGPSQNPPPRSLSSSQAANAAQIAANSSYRPPPVDASARVQNPYMPHNPNTLSHALERPRPSGFGVLRVQDPGSGAVPTSNKRRRGPDDEGRPVPPRTSAGPAPYRPQSASSATGEGQTSMTNGPPAPKPENTAATAIEISSSSGSESDIPAAPKGKAQPTPTPEKAKKNENPAQENGKQSTTEPESSEAEEPKQSSAGARRGFMAKRGGKH